MPPERLEFRGAARSFAWIMLPAILGVVTQFIVVSYTIHTVGTIAYGASVTMVAYLAFISILTGAISIGIIRDAALATRFDIPAQVRVHASHVLLIRIAALAPVFGIAIGVSLPHTTSGVSADSREVLLTAFLLSVATGIDIVVLTRRCILLGHEKFGRLARFDLLALFVRTATVLSLVEHVGIVALGLGNIVASGTQAVATVMAYRQVAPGRVSSNAQPNEIRPFRTLRRASTTIFLYATGALIAGSDSIVLGGVLGATSVTIYRVASFGPTVAFAFLYNAYAVLLPGLAKGMDEGAQERAIAQVTRLISWISGTGYALMALLAPLVVRTLLGRDDHNAVAVTYMFAGAFALESCYHGVIQVIFARGRQHIYARTAAFELTANLIMTFFFVRMWGLEGVGYATLITFSVRNLILFPFLLRSDWQSPPGRFMLKNGVLPLAAASSIVLSVFWILGCAIGKPGSLSRPFVLILCLTASGGVGFAAMSRPDRSYLRDLARGVGTQEAGRGGQ